MIFLFNLWLKSYFLTTWICLTSSLVVVFFFFVVVLDVVAVSAVLRMGDFRATTLGSKCFNKSVILRFVFNFRGPCCTVVPC